MLIRLALALGLGALLGVERELVGKEEAGVRTTMAVAGGAAIFTMMGIALPYILATDAANLSEIVARNSGFLTLIGNIVVGVGFLGAGTILKQDNHVKGLTTAAVIWIAAAVGVAAGLGIYRFAILSAILISGILYILKGFKVAAPKRKR